MKMASMSASSPPFYSGRYQDITDALSENLADAAGSGSLLASQHTKVLVPSRAAASSIMRSLLGRAPEGLAGLHLQTLETFARITVNAAGLFPQIASEEQRRVAMRKAAQSIDDPLLRTPAIETLLDRSYRDLRDSGFTLQELGARAGGRDRVRLLIRVWRAYEANLGRLNAIDPADLLAESIRLIESASKSENAGGEILFGFYDVTGMQRKLLQALLRAGTIRAVYWPLRLIDGELPTATRFAAPLLQMFRASTSEAIPVAAKSVAGTPEQVALLSFSTRSQQRREVCRTVRRLLDEGVLPGEVGIVSRSLDGLDSDSLSVLSREFGFSLTDRNGVSLRQQRVGRGILTLLRIADAGYPRASIMELLRDGFRSPLRSREIDRLDLLTRKFAVAGGGSDAVRKTIRGVESRDEKAASVLRAYQAVVSDVETLSAPLGESLSGNRWSEVLQHCVERFNAETELDLLAMERIEEIARFLSAADVLKAQFEPFEVADLIERAPPMLRRNPGAEIWYGDVMSLRGRSFKHLFLIGAEEDRLPQRRTPDPLLPDSERARMGIPLIGDGRSEEELLFQLVDDSAIERLTISYGNSDGFGRPLRASPFLLRLPVQASNKQDPVPLSARETLLDGVRRGKVARLTPSLLRKLERAAAVRGRSHFDGYLSKDEQINGEIRRRLLSISPTYLEDFGECPQKFLFRRLLRADELDDPEHEPQINYLDKGRLDHRILERFYREGHEEIGQIIEAGSPMLTPLLKNSLSIIVEEEFQRFDRESPPFNPTIRRLEQSLTESNLERFIGTDLVELMESGFRPIHYEYSFGTDRHGPAPYPSPIPLQVADIEMSLKGTIDRIDRAGAADSPVQRLRVVDYKSGKAGRHTSLSKKLEEGLRLQLALYALAAEEIFQLTASRISGTIKPLGMTGKQNLGRFGFELAEQKENLLKNLQLFVESMTAGLFPALPSEESCRYCPMNHSCRTMYDPEERRNLREFETVLQLLQSAE